MQVERGDHGHRGADDAPDHLQHRAFGIVIAGGQAGAMQNGIHGVELAGGRQIGLPALHEPIEERLIDRSIRLRHRQQARHRFPIARGVHRGDETGHLPQHARRGGAGLAQHLVAADQGARPKVSLRRDRRKAVALDREAQQGNARGS